MRRLLLLPFALLAVWATPASALPLPEGAHRNVELVGHLPAPETGAVSINFLTYEGGREVMFVSSSLGLNAYDVSRDPVNPAALGEIPSSELGGPLPVTASDSFFQNEDMDVDRERKLVFIARDLTSHTTAVPPGVFIVDAKDPANLQVLSFVPLPQGHTTSCVNGCTHLWTSGLLLRREIFATDITDPANPITSPVPVDVGPFDMPAGTSHDVNVDATGIAWVSGQGYLRGYHTSGTHLDPLLGVEREATPLLPVLYGGGKIPASDGGPSDQGRFVHGSERPVGPTASRGAPGHDGDLIYSAEEAYGACPVGPFVVSSLKDAIGTDATGTLETVGLWTPAEQEGMADGAECSAHWFTMRDGLVAHGWYEQGTRFLDVRDPRNPVQIGYYRPDDASTSAAYWHGDHVYVADYNRGVDILRFTGGEQKPAAPAVAPPAAAPCRPDAVLGRRGLRLSRRAVRLAGTAACGARVRVALARVQAGRCRFLKGRSVRRAGSCTRPVWLKARGSARWTFTARARLPRGSYTAFVRAAGGAVRQYRLDVRRGRVRPVEAVR